MKKIKDKVLNALVFDIYKKIGNEIETKYFTKFWYPFKYSREFISKTIMKDKQIFSFIIQFSVFNPERQLSVHAQSFPVPSLWTLSQS